MITGGPPPLPIRARNRGTPAQLANARVATSISWKALLAMVILFLSVFGTLYLIQMVSS